MAKYEIMLLVDPKTKGEDALAIVEKIFSNFKPQTLETTELAYEINKSKTGKYIFFEVDATGDQIKEFNRKANILKSLWRYIVINLDKEVGRDDVEEAMKRHAKKQAERAAYIESKMKERDFKKRSNRG